ncbi:MAG: glycosyltransferase family 39 protein [bacterium]
MKVKPIGAVALGWAVVTALLFGFFQFRGLVRYQPLGDYLLSAVGVLAAIVVVAALGLRVRPAATLGLGLLVTRSAVGLALLGISAFGLAAAGLLKPAAAWILLGLLGALSYRQVGHVARWARALQRPRDMDAGEAALVAVAGLGTLVLLVNCLAPLTSNDAMVYHLNIPKIYAAHSGLERLPYDVYANMPHYGETLYAFFYCLTGETGAKLLYFAAVIGAALAVYGAARMLVARKPALVSACLFLVQPLVLDHRTVANVDVLLAFFTLAAVALLVEAARTGATRGLAASVGLVAGFMLGIKYTAAAPCLALAALPLLAFTRRPAIRLVLVACLVAAAVLAPWIVKNEIVVGNPLYPLFHGTFGGANWDSAQETQLVAWQRAMGPGHGPADWLLLPFNLGLRGRPEAAYRFFDGTITPVWLMLLPLALLRRTRETAALGAMVLGTFIFWAVTSQQARFLMPCLALVAVLAAVGLGALADRIGKRGTGAIAVVAAIAALASLAVPDQHGRPLASGAGDRLPVVLGLEESRQYVERNVQSAAIFAEIHKRLPRREPIFMVWENRGYYLDNPYFADSFFEASRVMRLAAASGDGRELGRKIAGMGFKYVLVNDWLGEYFSRGYPREDVARLREFTETCLAPVQSANRMTLYGLRAE